MDVTCDRCNTRYEFDAALVSNRGTTVKCTNCGHQFKVFRPSELASLDGWTIRTLDGRELTFRAMRELQAAISNGDVSTEDVLLPGDNSEPRRLGKIEELRSFFGEPEDAHTEKRPARTESAPTIEHDIGLVKTNALGSYPGARPPTASAGSPVRRDREGNPMPSRTGTTLPPPTKAPPSRPAPPPRPRFKQSSDDDELLRPDAPTRERLPPEPPTLKGELPVRKVLERLGEAPPSYPGKPAARDKPSDGKIQAVDALNNAVQAMFAGAPSSGAALGQADLIESNWEESTQPRAFGKREESPSLSDEDTLGDNDRQGAMPPPVAVPNEPPQQLSPQQPSIIFEGDSVPPPTPSFTPSVARPSILRRSEVYSDPRFTTYGPRGGQRSMVRWVVGLMSLGLLGVVGFTLFKRYVQPTAKPEASAVKEDERVTKFLEEGDARLFAGDVEGAKDLYTKASGIAENDARVAQSLARVEVIRADLLWLHMRLLEDDAPNRAIVAQQLARAVARAEQAEKTLAERAPRDSSSVGMKIDILRLKGKGNDARKLTSSLKDGGADGGRVLAALDLIESSPNYRKVIDRLRAATKSERKLGRAHAMLIYALARSGEAGDAQKELDALAAQNENFPLLDPLKRYVEDTEDRKDEDAKGSDEIPEDYREALKRATAARKVGDLDRAERLYRAALAKKPGNSEALAGLAAIERDRGDAGGAEKRYKDMLAKNPNYIPAMIGLADMKWASGNRSEAISIYRQVVKSAPGTDWATHAQARIDEGAAAPASSAPSPATGPKPPPPSGHPAPEQPSASAAPDVPPHVDVTDLPEYQ